MKELILNGTKVTMSKENGITKIEIDTKDADIVVNSETIWSYYNDPAYKEIPSVMRTFIKERASFIGEIVGNDNLCVDLNLKDSKLTPSLYFPKNKRDSISARFDFITSMDELEHEHIRVNANIIEEKIEDKLVNELQLLSQNIHQAVQESGYQLRPAHESGVFLHRYWDIVFPIENWNEEKFLHIWSQFDAFEVRWAEILDEYGYDF